MERTSANQRFLMREIVSGSSVAFAELFDQLGAETYRACLEYLPYKADAEYATLRIWLHIWQNAATIIGQAYNPSVTILAIAERYVQSHTRDRDATITQLHETTPARAKPTLFEPTSQFSQAS